jgi:hypothetical protein
MRWFQAILAFVLLAVLLVALSRSSAKEKKDDESGIETRSLIVVRDGARERPITAHVGDVIQLRPFSLPVTPDYLDARLTLKLSGGQTVEEIGQIATSPHGEGRRSLNIFLYVRESGRTDANVSVALDGQKGSDRFNRTYIIQSSE